MKNTLSAVFRLFLTIVICSFALSISASSQESSAAKAGRLLNESGINFTKVAKDVWTVPFEGKNLRSFQVLVGVDKDVLVMFVIVTDKKKYTRSPELLNKLLSQNDQMDRVKIGIDKQGEIAVRIDLTVRLLDKRELSENLDQLAAASDEIFAIVQPYLVK
jgi:hypothetical protein